MNTKAIFYIIIASFCYASFPPINKYLLNRGVTPIELILALNVLMFPVAFSYVISKKEQVKKITKLNWKYIFSLGLLATALGRALSIWGQQYTLAMNNAVLMKLTVVIVPLIAYFMLKERLPRQKYIAMVVAFFGAFLLITGGSLLIPYPGDIVFLIVAIMISFTNVFAKIVSKDVDSTLLSMLRLSIGSGLLFLFIFADGFKFISVLISYWPIIIFESILGISMIIALYAGIKLSTASEATALFLLSAPISFVLSYFILGETMSTVSFLGAIMLLISCYFIAKKTKILSGETVE